MVVVEKVSSIQAAVVNTALPITAPDWGTSSEERCCWVLVSNLYAQQGTPTLVGLCIYKEWTLSYLRVPYRKQPTIPIFHSVLPGWAVSAPSSRLGLGPAQPEHPTHCESQTFNSDKEFRVTDVFQNIISESCGILQMKMQIQYNAWGKKDY